jgi:hypothetical protein
MTTEPGVTQRFHGGEFWITVDGGDEFAVNPARWNDQQQRAAIIALERQGTPRPQP